MGWERRGNRLYYYRKRRVGRRVVSGYMGASEFAEVVATLDQYDRLQRELERFDREEERRELERDREIDREIDQVGAAIRALRDVVLLVGGYRSHKGQWRKKRNGKAT